MQSHGISSPLAGRSLAPAIVLLWAGLAFAIPVGGQVTMGAYFVGTASAHDFELRVNAARALSLLTSTGTPSLVAGASANAVTVGRVGATVGGGGGAVPNENRVGGDYGRVGGGFANLAGGELSVDNYPQATVGGGSGNSAFAHGATVGGGLSNLASGAGSTIAGGEDNLAAGTGSTVGGGRDNRASADYATIPGGADASASLWGQMAFSSGGFGAQAGNAQASVFVLRRVTTNNTPLELLLDGSSAHLEIASGQTLAFRALIAGRSDGGDSAGYLAIGVITNQGGTTTFIGTPTLTVLGEDNSAWNLFLTADDVNDALVISALGSPSTTVRWTGTVETTEVTQ